MVLFSLQWPCNSGMHLHSSECVPFTPLVPILCCIASAAQYRDTYRGKHLLLFYVESLCWKDVELLGAGGLTLHIFFINILII